ncbi:MAG TPA: VCBS repeat domain-containing M23 family metallopeptidase, partial [Candidatus Dojkabacteria bacterium]
MKKLLVLSFSIVFSLSLFSFFSQKASAVNEIQIAPPCNFWYVTGNRPATVAEVNSHRDHWSHVETPGDGLQDHGRSVDIAGNKGTPTGLNGAPRPYLSCENSNAYASIAGTIEYNYGYGNTIKINGASGVTVLYGHLNSFAVAEGSSVNVGDYIGQIGTTGSTGGFAHIHFNVYENGLRQSYNSQYSTLENQWEFVDSVPSPTPTPTPTPDPKIISELTGDFNGDGRDDVAMASEIGTTDTLQWIINITASSGDRFASSTNWTSVNNVWGGRPSYDQFHIGDFNGDGKDDIAMASKIGTTDTLQWLIMITAPTGDKFASNINWTTINNVWGGRPSYNEFHVGDFNGDGKDDIAMASEIGTTNTLQWLVMTTASTGDRFASNVNWTSINNTW